MKPDWENIISIDSATGVLKIKDYSNANLADFDEAQIYAKVENSHFLLSNKKVATLTFKHHYCNYKGFKDKSKEIMDVKLSYESWVPW